MKNNEALSFLKMVKLIAAMVAMRLVVQRLEFALFQFLLAIIQDVLSFKLYVMDVSECFCFFLLSFI